jgi:hypothetical protein
MLGGLVGPARNPNYRTARRWIERWPNYARVANVTVQQKHSLVLLTDLKCPVGFTERSITRVFVGLSIWEANIVPGCAGTAREGQSFDNKINHANATRSNK